MPSDVLVDAVFRVTFTNVRKSRVDHLRKVVRESFVGSSPQYDAVRVEVVEQIDTVAISEGRVAELEQTITDIGHDLENANIENGRLNRELLEERKKLAPKDYGPAQNPDGCRYGLPKVLDPNDRQYKSIDHTETQGRTEPSLPKEPPVAENNLQSGAVVDRENELKIIEYLKKKPERNLGSIAIGIGSTRSRCKRLAQGMVEDGRLKVVVKGEDEQTESVYVVSDIVIAEQEQASEVASKWKPTISFSGDEKEKERAKKVVAFLEKNPGATKVRLEKELGISYFIIRRIIDDLKHKGVIRIEGIKMFAGARV